MMLNKIIKHIKRFIVRNYEKIVYFKSCYEDLCKKIDNSKKNRIWFIGSADYSNIGDLAISEATLFFIEQNRPNYTILEIRLSDYFKYVNAIKKLIKANDIIVLQGGGNMGFKYFDAEMNRRFVIKKFKKNKIIIFPSTIDYGLTLREKIEYNNSIKIYNKHKNLIICAREYKSYSIMKKIYNNVILVPDIVLSLECKNYNLYRSKFIVCLRNDNEKTKYANTLLQKMQQMDNCLFIDNISQYKNISINLRKEIVMNKLKEISTAKIVITDRLHVMIFCVITETPCLFIDNSNNKISGVFDLWINKKCNYIKKIDNNIDINIQIKDMIKVKPFHYFNFSLDFGNLLKYL